MTSMFKPATVLPLSRAGPTAVPVLVHNCGDNDPSDLTDHARQDSAASNTNNQAGTLMREELTSGKA
jgi:hypothetical protein